MFFFFEHHGMKGKDFFQVSQLDDQSFPSHLHRAYELVYVTEGTVGLEVEKKPYTMARGDLAFVFSNQIHHFTTPNGSEIQIILFSPEIIGGFYTAYRDSVPEDNVIHFEEELDFYSCKSLYAQKSILYHVCDELLKKTAMKPASSNSQTAVLQQIFAYVDKHYGTDCSLKTISGSIQYDYAYLSKLFAKMTGMRFTEYLNNYRIAQACYLLKEQQMSVSEIASRCGYENLRTFHRNFRLVMECSPREYVHTEKSDGL